MTQHLERTLTGVRLLMLDFDGPICSVFARHTAPTVAQELRKLLAALERPITDAIRDTNDPLQVLRLVASTYGQSTVGHIEKALRDAEIRAVESAEPTPGVAELITHATSNKVRLAVVSNNSRDAVSRYLKQMGFSPSFAAVAGRYQGQPPSLLKPSPHLVDLALRETETDRHNAVLVGDSVSDVLAASAAGVRCIAFRSVADELTPLVAAGADAAITTIYDLARAIG